MSTPDSIASSNTGSHGAASVGSARTRDGNADSGRKVGARHLIHPTHGDVAAIAAGSRVERWPLALLLVATVLFALGPALLKSLMNVAATLGLYGTGSISFCNVLFVGNLCAGLVTLFVSGPRRIAREYAHLPRRTKFDLLIAAVVSTIHPALLFTALERSSVINLVLLSRFNGIVYVLAGYLFLRIMVGRAEVLGYAIIGLGVIALLLINNMGAHVSSGDWLILLASVFFVLTELVSKRVLRVTGIPLYVFFRNFVSALIFFATAIYLFGFEHFEEAFRRDLWILMVIYATVAIVVAQAAWLKAIRVLPVKLIANSQLLNPGFSILFAFLLLGEVPTATQSVIILLVVVGTAIPYMGRARHVSLRARAMSIDTSLTAR